MMDKKLIVHVAAETIVLGSLTVYLINRIGALESRVSELEKDIQAIAKHSVTAEKKQVEILNAMSYLIKGDAKNNHNSHSGHNHVVHNMHKKVATPPQSDKKKVSFSDADDVEDDESEEPLPQPKVKPKKNTKSNPIKVASSDNVRLSRKGMDDVRAAAAALAPDEDD